MSTLLRVLVFVFASAVALHTRAGTPAPTHDQHASVPFDVVISPPAPSRQKIIDFWTRERMEEAWPASFSPPYGGDPIEPFLDPKADHSGYTLMPSPYASHLFSRLTGILYFRRANTNGEGYVVQHCSASIIHSISQNLILTAAHCVHEPIHHVWNDMFMFVPGFDGKQAPLEKWPIQSAYIPGQDAQESPETDIAVARVYPLPSGKTLEAEVGPGTAFFPHVSTNENEAFSMVKDVGYPSVSRFGEDPVYENAEQRQCNSGTAPGKENPKTLLLLNCTPQAGNSGGPIVRLFNPPFEVVGVFVKTNPLAGQARLLPQTFVPIYKAADSTPK